MSVFLVRSLALAALCAVVLAAGCGKDPLSPEEQADKLVADGWSAFAKGDYPTAEALFRNSTTKTPSAAASLGTGWSLLLRGSLASARTELGRIRPEDATYYDAQAGIAIASDAEGAYDRAITAAAVVLVADATWTHSHAADIDWRDLAFVLAKALLIRAPDVDPTLDDALAALRRIDSGPALVAGNPETWVAGGVRYATLAEATLRRLELAQESVATAP